MERTITKIVVVGGGTAGWLAACLAAARARDAATPGRPNVSVTLIESPDIPTIGVGEGTWPTMRRTLERIGIAETEFLLACDASFKQGTRFAGWRSGAPDDVYFHPFSPPVEGDPRDVISAWRDAPAGGRFDMLVSPQPHVCEHHLAPRKRAMPDYAAALNYGYHLDAGKLAALLAHHGVERLGVRHIRDTVTAIESGAGGDISAVVTRAHGAVGGDLFLDCTGHAALLIGGHFGVPFVDRANVLPNDRALAVQVPVAPGAPIASQTTATAHAGGWIWDIGLPTRRGMGCVYSSHHTSDEDAALALRRYLATAAPDVDPETMAFRKLSFRSGHRERFWERNCLAVGQAAGFLEPLEASAIVTIELAMEALLDGFPATRGAMDLHAARFNALFAYRWQRIVEFLKLHYVLSSRDEPYWRAHRDSAAFPEGLSQLLALWRERPPMRADFPQVDEVFPAASYQYILYGMGFAAPADSVMHPRDPAAVEALRRAAHRARVLASSLPSNRAYLDALRAEHGSASIMEAAC